ncbi:ubiquitin carboxyl-terminal hydrolase 47 [Trichonephila inaurata madagascariensis]|uniref:Ubiquitin carboxyl-terminal hydrolase 47 n=1 Tax=Trichonephila inaurata madagascariensis TaxID=2747483 RepID=A0A8X6Y1G3_9ARAC|nr:ubiquitin carboxyl-terminal hydrolase 47 [Trichonephila inaurata madagascariensis]
MVPGENKQLVAVTDMCATATSAADEPRALCIVRDMSADPPNNQKAVINLPASMTACQLLHEVAKKFQYEPDSFELLYPRITDKAIVNVHKHNEETLEELGFRCGGNQRNNLIIDKKHSMPPKKINVTECDSQIVTNDDEQTVPEIKDNSSYVPPPAPPPYTPGTSEFSYNYNYSNSLPRQETGLVGLVNQAMTCYLNSLLQTLFMTPEFRNALYRWEFDGTEEEGTKSIPFQLQKLFLQLQTSKKPAVGTTELTTSFGWDSSEAWQQHDVQELCRVMFDALEQKFKNTEQADLISTLYEGKLKDYVKCLECGYESAREDTFLDVPLVVRPFGSSQSYSSVGEALQAFVTPETLQGSNQYFCERCNKKCDAHKGLKFTKFPYLLTLQLKRFDFDPVMHRIKLNDRVTFPDILNLNDFIKSEKQDASGDSDSAVVDEDGDCSPKTACATSSVSEDDLADDDEGIDMGSNGPSSEQLDELCSNEKKKTEKGPYVYDLFSIMVHSGSANGGHYYAYIKSFKDGEWYCFNDAQVTRITHDDIQKTYGGGPSRGYYSSAYSSSTNAYMLMYRQIDQKKNAEYMSEADFPEHIKANLQSMQEQEERERLQKELDRSMCKIKLFCHYPIQKRMNEMKLKVHKDCTLAEATATAHSIMGLEGVVPVECCRLVKYDDFHDSLECSFDGCDDEPMGELLGGVKSSYKFELFLEIRKPHEKFQEYKPGGTTIKVHIVDLEKEEVAIHPLTIRSHPSNTVQELEAQIAQALGIPADSKVRIVLEAYSNECKLLNVPLHTLSSEGFRKSNKIFVEYKDAADAEKPYEESKLFKVLDTYAHTICIHMSIPNIDKANLDRLRLYDDVSDEGRYDISSEEEENGDSAGMDATPEKAKYFSRTKVNVTWFERLYVPHDYDEGLGDSEVGDSVSNNSQGVSQAIHSDQSEDSSLTDSERTLVGDELSPRNNSPDIMGTEMEQDIEPSITDVTKPECDSLLMNSDNSHDLLCQNKCRNLSSPEENTEDFRYCNHTDCSKNSSSCANQTVKRFFRAWPYTDYETGEKMLRVYLDKRITLAELKRELESHINIKADSFKIFRVYSNNQEFECTRLSDNLMSYGDDSRLTIKLGRALRKGEYKVKIYQLCVNESEPFKFLIDWVIVKGMTVLKLKKEILPQIKETTGLDIPLNRCRLRKKSWKNPGCIYFDHQRFEKDIPVNANWEMFLEVLPDAEPVASNKQLTLFSRLWHPAAYKLDPFKEIVLDDTKFETLLHKLHEISGIPVECIELAKGQGTFPCEVSLLTIHNELEWLTQQPSVSSWPLCISDDGQVVYYRDTREELKKLTEEEKREISNKENARSNKNLKSYYSPRKEKALKIYTGDSPSNTTQTSQSAQYRNSSTQSAQPVVPDLD